MSPLAERIAALRAALESCRVILRGVDAEPAAVIEAHEETAHAAYPMDADEDARAADGRDAAP